MAVTSYALSNPRSQVFDGGTMIENLEALLKWFKANPGASVLAIALTTTDDNEQLIVFWE